MDIWLNHLGGQKSVIASVPTARKLSRITLLPYLKTQSTVSNLTQIDYFKKLFFMDYLELQLHYRIEKQ